MMMKNDNANKRFDEKQIIFRPNSSRYSYYSTEAKVNVHLQIVAKDEKEN
jgi:hypothetical protein